ncbi:MAG: ankyrin repeat domain-containing protein [Bryobacteraceae bacterium]
MWILFLLAAVALAQSPKEIQTAIDKALPPLQRSAASFVKQRACFSCHHNGLAIMTFRMAKDRGVRIDDAVLGAVEEKTWKSGGTFDEVFQARNVNDPTPNDSLLLMAKEAAGVPRDAADQVRVKRMASWQREDGHWITSDFRPPHSSSVFTATATAVRAMGWTAGDARIAKAAQWLKANKPVSTEDASFRLMGLVWAHAGDADVAEARRDLLAMQKANGGWAQLASYGSDAYSTGEAVFALKESGIDSPKGIRFLISNQAKDGTWHVRSRMVSPAEVSPPYFETGFPYKKDQFLSYAGSCWATMALLSTLPGKATSLSMTNYEEPASDGLPKYTQLIMAASYYGNTSNVAALLDAGAPVAAPEGTKSRVTPLLLASISGDLATVKLLLQHKADPNAGAPLAEAITYDHADVARALVAAGASADGVEGTGINLMHWATITNRPELIPVLLEAKVPLDEVDDNGYTPLMYAASIDFGETKTLDALLKAGANRDIKDYKNRTALQHAQRLGHAAIIAKLRAHR